MVLYHPFLLGGEVIGMSVISSDMKRFSYEVENLKTEFVLDFNDSLTRAEEFVAEISELKSDVNAAYGNWNGKRYSRRIYKKNNFHSLCVR